MASHLHNFKLHMATQLEQIQGGHDPPSECIHNIHNIHDLSERDSASIFRCLGVVHCSRDISGLLQGLSNWQTRAEVGESTIGFK